MGLLDKLFNKKDKDLNKTMDDKKNTSEEVVDKWFEVKRWGNGWAGTTLYVNPAIEGAKIREFEITHWGYHDECDMDESESIISIEQALSMVYLDETALSFILNKVSKDYSMILEKLKTSGEPTDEKLSL